MSGLAGHGGWGITVKPEDEKIAGKRDLWSGWRICQFKKTTEDGRLIECGNGFRILLRQWVGKTQVRHNGNLNHRYCSEQCRYLAMLERSRKNHKKKPAKEIYDL